MDLVVDANILFSAAIRDGKTAELLLRDDLHLYAPEFLFVEFRKYEDSILEKTHRSSDDFQRFVDILEKRIDVIPKEEFSPRTEEADEASPDPDDVPYLALALERNADLWSDDEELSEQDAVKVWKTHHLVERLEGK